MRSSSMIGSSLGIALAALSLGCASGSTSAASPTAMNDRGHAAELWSDKCGSCHVPVEPGSRPRAAIEAAMQRHRARAKLTAREWAEIVDFLAAPRHEALERSTTNGRRDL